MVETTTREKMDEPFYGAGAQPGGAGKASLQQEGERLMETGRSSATEQKNLLARGMNRISIALRRTAGNLREENDASTARYFDMAAEKVGYVSSSLENKDLDALLADSREFARRHPVMVFGGAVVVGLAASRLMKSSAIRKEPAWKRETAPEFPGRMETEGEPGTETRTESLSIEEVEKRKSRPYGKVKPGEYGSDI